jgi:hypothetical protein
VEHRARVKQRTPADLVRHLLRIQRRQRGNAECNIVEHLHEDATQPEHPKVGIRFLEQVSARLLETEAVVEDFAFKSVQRGRRVSCCDCWRHLRTTLLLMPFVSAALFSSELMAGKAAIDQTWVEAARRCRLSQDEVRMTRGLGFKPRSLLKNTPSPHQPWKAPTAEWVRDPYGRTVVESARRGWSTRAPKLLRPLLGLPL